MKTEKKFVILAAVIGSLVFLLICAALSLIALREAIRERDAAVREAGEDRMDPDTSDESPAASDTETA